MIRRLVLLGRIVNGADTDNTLYDQPEGRASKLSPKAFGISASRTTMNTMRRSGLSTTRSMRIAARW